MLNNHEQVLKEVLERKQAPGISSNIWSAISGGVIHRSISHAKQQATSAVNQTGETIKNIPNSISGAFSTKNKPNLVPDTNPSSIVNNVSAYINSAAESSAENLDSFSHKAGTKLKRTLHKKLGASRQNLLLKALPVNQVNTLVPILGTVLKAGYDFIVDSLAKQWVDEKKNKYASIPGSVPHTPERLRKATKWQVKSLPDAAQKLDSTLAKYKVALRDFEKYKKDYRTKLSDPFVDYGSGSLEQLRWNYACSYFKAEYYHIKAQSITKNIKYALEHIDRHLEKSTSEIQNDGELMHTLFLFEGGYFEASNPR